MKFSRYSYIFIAVVFVILVTFVSYFLGIKDSDKNANTVNIESTATPVPSIVKLTPESGLSATPTAVIRKVSSVRKIGI